jgi:hypothetical protein
MSFRAVVMLNLAAFALSAQTTTRENLRDTAPVRYWSAPLYWQPSAAERSASPKLMTASASSPSANALTFVALTPCRVIDTRSPFNFPAPFGAPSLVGGGTRSFPLEASTFCSIPSTALAYSLNVTVTPAGGAGLSYLTLWPSGAVQPNASTLNNPNALPALANAAIVPAGNDGEGSIDAYASDATDLIVDINGYYSGETNAATFNTSVGQYTLNNNTTGYFNVGTGFTTLQSNTTGYDNTGTGTSALQGNTTGGDNTATGFEALFSNTTAGDNTADGFQALLNNTTGSLNTAVGSAALLQNTTGSYNTANGYQALNSSTAAIFNTASGYQSLQSNKTGYDNTAVGAQALFSSTGFQNTAVGFQALYDDTTGVQNTAVGLFALGGNKTGQGNIALGLSAGEFINGSNNIDIGNGGTSSDNAVIRIGNQGVQTATYIAGIYDVAINCCLPVYMSSTGQLGFLVSSQRYKDDIRDMGDASSRVMELRPVTFHYKKSVSGGSNAMQYGLIAEEVARIYPDLIVRDSHGEIEAVQYEKLTPMLLNELQKESELIRKLEGRLQALEEQRPASGDK